MLSEYIHDKAIPALVHSKFNEPVEEEEEQSDSVALELDSEELKSKLEQILIAHGAKGTKKLAKQSKAQEHNLQMEETKAKVIKVWENKPKDLLQILWEHGFIDEMRLDSSLATHGMESRMHLDFSRNNFC